VIGGLFTAAVSILNARSASENALAAEREKLRSSIILQAIRTDSPQQALANLKFFAQLGFIDLDPAQLQELERQPGSVPVLPTESSRVLSMAERDQLLGRPEIRRQEPGSVTVELDEDWVKENIVVVEIPQLRGVPTASGGTFAGNVRFHKKAAPALQAAFAEIERRGLLGDIKSFDGSFAPRVVRGSMERLSAHALGIAFDINVQANSFGEAPAPEGTPGSVRRLVPIFEGHGFVWGGRSRVPDGNHFEFADRAALTQAGQ
jgi:hypothetical protein